MTPSMFESIYKAYFGRVYHYLLARCRDHHLAEELTAETFFRALRGLGGFRGDCDPGTWLCRIAGNLYASHLRKPPGPQPLEEALDLPDPAAPGWRAHGRRRADERRVGTGRRSRAAPHQ